MRAAIYARISDDDKGERLGITDQIEDCQSRAESEGWLSEVFSDNDIGAFRKKHRPGYEAMLDDLRSGKFDVLLARDDGRFTRNMPGFLELLAVVEEGKIQVVTLWTDRWDLSTAAGRKRVRDSASDAQYEAERTAERVARARLRGAKKGLPSPGGQRAYGFKADRITHEPKEAAAIRDIANRVLSGKSLRSASLTYELDPKNVRRLLLASRVAGIRSYKGVEYPAVWDPILDLETWKSVCAVLSVKSRDGVAGVVARKYLLTGFLWCGVCDARCFPFKRADGGAARYVCHPGGHVARVMTRLDDLVRDAVLARADLKVTPPEIDPALPAAVAGYEARLSQARELFMEGGLSKDEYATMKTDLETRLSAAVAALAAVGDAWSAERASAERHPSWDPTSREAPFDAYYWWSKADLRERRKLIDRHIVRINVHKSGMRSRFDPASVEIIWR